MNETKFNAALEALARAAEALDDFLARHAPFWAGYWRQFATNARRYVGTKVSKHDLRGIADGLRSPYRGTMGSMTDLAFDASDEPVFKNCENALFDAWAAVEAAHREGEPNEGRIRYALVALETELLHAGHREARLVREVLNSDELYLDEVTKLPSLVRGKVSPAALSALERELPPHS